MKNIIFISLLITWTCFSVANHICFVIHGTWAPTETWYQPGGDFFEALNASAHTKNIHLVPFTWSGKNDYASRKNAGANLARLISTYPTTNTFSIVAHSHGGNIGIIASQELAKAKTGHPIAAFYALGCPVETRSYQPNMDVIRYFFNLFSCNDFVQPILGIFERTYPDHPRIANIRILLDNKEPDHYQLHSKTIATWLFELPTCLPTKNSRELDCVTPALVQFFSAAIPRYTRDEHRTAKLAQDRWITSQLLGPLQRSVPRESHSTDQ